MWWHLRTPDNQLYKCDASNPMELRIFSFFFCRKSPTADARGKTDEYAQGGFPMSQMFLIKIQRMPQVLGEIIQCEYDIISL